MVPNNTEVWSYQGKKLGILYKLGKASSLLRLREGPQPSNLSSALILTLMPFKSLRWNLFPYIGTQGLFILKV
jgi:hypothetical protein